MAREAWVLAAFVALAAGCGQSLPSAPLERGAALVKAGDYDQAIAALTEATRLDPRDAQGYLLRGRAHQCRNHAGDLDAAIADFTTAIGLAPKDSESYYSRAIAYRDRADAAQDDAAKAVADDAQARRLDGRLAEEFRQMPSIIATPSASPPLAANETPPDEASAENEPAKTETSTDLIRRLEAAAATEAAKRSEESRRGGAAAGSRSSTSKAGGDARSRSAGKASPRTGVAGDDSLLTRPDAEDRARYSTLDGVVPGAPLTPRPGLGPSTASGVPLTLPSASPYGALSPYRTPAALPAASPYPLQPQSPFPQRAPSPTGFVEEPSAGPLRVQPRPYYQPNPIRASQLPAVRYGDYNP